MQPDSGVIHNYFTFWCLTFVISKLKKKNFDKVVNKNVYDYHFMMFEIERRKV